MNRLKTFGLIGLAGFAMAAMADYALGLGGLALLAGVGSTLLADGAAEAADALPTNVNPELLIVLSLCVGGAALVALGLDRRKARAGHPKPDEAERTVILSAMLLMATLHGKTSRNEIMDVFRIVTGHRLEESFVDLARERFVEIQKADIRSLGLPKLETSIARRRTIAAALMVGCVVRPAAPGVNRLIERIAFDIRASADDVAAARRALSDWQDDASPVEGTSLVALLRHRVLSLKPA